MPTEEQHQRQGAPDSARPRMVPTSLKSFQVDHLCLGLEKMEPVVLKTPAIVESDVLQVQHHSSCPDDAPEHSQSEWHLAL